MSFGTAARANLCQPPSLFKALSGNMHAFILLAAGQGRRFSSIQHKSLAPLQFGEGSLPRLLRGLHQQGSSIPPGGMGPVLVVTGQQFAELAQTVREVMPTARCIVNPEPANRSMLSSLCAGLRALEGNASLEGAWVLFADTLYPPDVLAQLMPSRSPDIVLASVPASEVTDNPVGLRHGPAPACELLAIGPTVVAPDAAMAPAVFWPRHLWAALSHAENSGKTAQWQVIHDLLPESPARVLPLPGGRVRDVDTAEDLARLRERMISETSFSYFRRNLSKDERTLEHPDRLEQDRFVKHCGDETSARFEFDVMRWLEREPGESLVPAIEQAQGPSLVIEHVRGIRMYEMLQLLAQVAHSEPALAPRAQAAAETLIDRGVNRLERIQRSLTRWPGAARCTPYPLEWQIRPLLSALADVLDLKPLHAAGEAELDELFGCWVNADVSVPFRDATTKNTMVAIPELAACARRSEHERRTILGRWLIDENAPARVRMVEYDFTSAVHLTAPEDDFISLLAHEGSAAHYERLLRRQRPNEGPPLVAIARRATEPDQAFNGPRAARALFVRYLRFGGRKLMYRAVNPAGFAVRFRQDHAGYYLQQLPGSLRLLDPDFPERWPHLHRWLERLGDAVGRLPSWRAEESVHDTYLRRIGRPVRYWSESPVEALATVDEQQ